MTRQNQIVFHENRTRILNYTMNHLQIHDEKELSISKICRDLKISHNTFYNHYSNLGELYEDIRLNIFNDFKSGITKTFSSLNKTDENYVFSAIYGFLDVIKGTSDSLKILKKISNEKYLDEIINDRTKKFVLRFLQKPQQKMQQTDVQISIFINASMAIIKTWEQNHFDLPEQYIANIIYTLFHSTCHDVEVTEDVLNLHCF